jgi:hypothetical protein
MITSGSVGSMATGLAVGLAGVVALCAGVVFFLTWAYAPPAEMIITAAHKEMVFLKFMFWIGNIIAMMQRKYQLKIIRFSYECLRINWLVYTLINILRIYNIRINTQMSSVIIIALTSEALKGENQGSKTIW